MEFRKLLVMVVLAPAMWIPRSAAAQSLPDVLPTRMDFCTARGECANALSSDEQTFVRLHVNNVGIQATAQRFIVELSVNDTISLQAEETAPLAPGETRTITFNVGTLPAGAYRVAAVTDPGEEIAELDDANNTLARTLAIVSRSATASVTSPRRAQPSAMVAAAATRNAAASEVGHAPAMAANVVATPAESAPTSSPAPVTDESQLARPIIQVEPAAAVVAQEPASGLVEPVKSPEAAELAIETVSESGAMVPEAAVSARPPTGRITGQIFEADSGRPLSGMGVGIYDAFGQLADWQTTDAAGTYLTRHLPAGGYQVVTHRNFGWQNTIVRDVPITKYQRVRLRHGESFRLATAAVDDAAAGDFYLGFFNEAPQFWANHNRQRGVMSLGDIRSTPLDVIAPPSPACETANVWQVIAPTSCYSRGAVDAIRGHTYVAVARRGDPAAFVVFRVVDVQPGLWVDLAYLVTPGVARGVPIDVNDAVTTTGIDQRVAPVPAVFGLAPARGPADGGTLVTITGANFQDGAAVSFGGTFAGDVVVLSPTQLLATAPPAAGGSVDVEVWHHDGSSALAVNAYRYDVPAPAAFAKLPTSADALLTGPILTLRWHPSPGAVAYQLCIDAVDDDRCTPEASPTQGWAAAGDATAVSWSRLLLTPGTTYYWQVKAVNTSGAIDADAGEWSAFAVASVAIAELTTPVPGSTLTVPDVRFEWTPGRDVAIYHLLIGSTPGAGDLLSVFTTMRSETVSLPHDGRAIFVRLGSLIGGDWLYQDSIYTAASFTNPRLGLGSGGPNGGPKR